MVNKQSYLRLVNVQALQLLVGKDPGDGTAAEMAAWCGGKASWGYDGELDEVTAKIEITSVEPFVTVNPTEWLVKDPQGAWLVMSDELFNKTYTINHVVPKDMCSYCLSDMPNTKMWDGGKNCPNCSSGYTGGSRIHEFEVLKAAGAVAKEN